MQLRWTQARSGFVVARLRAAVPGAAWDRRGAESGLVQLFLDGAYHQDVILVRGDAEVEYERLLGEVPVGEHLLEVRPHPAAAGTGPGGAQAPAAPAPGRGAGAAIAAAGSAPPPCPARPDAVAVGLDVRTVVPRDPCEALALREAPVIYTRAEGHPWESLWTDTPLLVFHRPADGGVEFQCMFSNEDAGTDTRGLLAQWGRTTDIEWVLRVPDDEPSAVPGGGEATIQGRGHRTEVHSGHRVLGRRTLQVVGLHGMVSSERPWGVMRCLFPPLFRWDDRLPREVCMDPAPWTYRIAALEMVREGKVGLGTPAGDPTPGDGREYVFVQVRREDRGAPRTGIEILATTATGEVFSSTHGDPAQACRRAQPFSTTVKLPPGASVCRIDAVAWPPPASGEIRLGLHRAFRLGPAYLPLPPFAPAAPDAVLGPGAARVTLWSAGEGATA